MNTYIQSLYVEANNNNKDNSDMEVISKENASIYCHKFILNSSELFKTYINSEFYKKEFHADFSFNALSFMIKQLYLINEECKILELKEKIECYFLRDMMQSKNVKLVVPIIECTSFDDLIILIGHTLYEEIKKAVDDYLDTNKLELSQIKELGEHIIGRDIIISELYDDEELQNLYYEYGVRFTYMLEVQGSLLNVDEICDDIDLCIDIFNHYNDIKYKPWYKKKYNNFYGLDINKKNIKKLISYYGVIKNELNAYFGKKFISVDDMFLLSKNKFEYITINLLNPVIQNEDIFIDFVKKHKINLNITISNIKYLDRLYNFVSIIRCIILKDINIGSDILNKINKIRMVVINKCIFDKSEILIKSKYLEFLKIINTNISEIILKTPRIITLNLDNSGIEKFKNIKISDKYKRKLFYVTLNEISDDDYKNLIKFNHCLMVKLNGSIIDLSLDGSIYLKDCHTKDNESFADESENDESDA
jgi:hypothetical protein